MVLIWIAAGCYLLLVLAGWAMTLHFANEPWFAAFVPGFGLYKRFRAIDKLSLPFLERGIVSIFDKDYHSKSMKYVYLLSILFLYLYGELLMHLTVFWKMARKAEAGPIFALGMVICPPLFMAFLYQDKNEEARAIRAAILQQDQAEKEKKQAEKQWMAGPALRKCPQCGAQQPADRAKCGECGYRHRE